MKKIILLLIILSCAFSNSYTQEDLSRQSYTYNTVVRLHFLAPGLMLEFPMGETASMTLDLQTGFEIGWGTFTSNNGTSSYSYTHLYPCLSIAPRYYTTLEKRREMHRRFDFFSSQYISLKFSVFFETQYTQSIKTLGPIWGFQTSFSKRGYINIGFGYGIYWTEGDSDFCPVGDFGLGIILNKI